MNRYNVNVLAEAKKEYTAQLVNTITPEIYIGVKSMYTAASEFCKRTNEKNVLIKFQTLLAKTDIKKFLFWNVPIKGNENFF